MGHLPRLVLLFMCLLNVDSGQAKGAISTTIHPVLADDTGRHKQGAKQTSQPRNHTRKIKWTDNNAGEPTELRALLNDFSRYRLGIAVAQANQSHANDLGRFEAEADVAEAEQRRQEAYIRTIKTKSVFDSSKSVYNLGYIGRGYDIFRGHPMSPDGTVDPGFRLPVIDLPYTWRHTADGEYRVPDNVDVVAEPSAKFVASSSIVSNERSYKASLSQSVSVGASVQGGFGMFSAKASFSANSDYKRDTNELRKSQNSYMDTVGKATVYKARLCQTDRSSKMSLGLESAFQRLPSSKCTYGDEQSLHGYMQIIREFGTHFTTSVVMGARAVQRRVIKKSTAQSYLKEMRSQGFEAGLEVGIGPVSIGAHVSNKDSSSSESASKQDQESTETREFYVGGSAPEGSLEDGSTESLRTWARSAKENPAPIQYTLTGIDELLNGDVYFRTPMTWLTRKRNCLRLAIQKYCLETVPDPSNCVFNKMSAPRRRKRSADDTAHQYIKYGDLIVFKSPSVVSDILLSVSDQVDIVGGEGVCHVIKTEEKSRPGNRNYFQILPEAGQGHLMGQNLTYGDTFRLSTVKGDDLFVVPYFGSDVIPLLKDSRPDDIYKLREVGKQLCVIPRATPGRTHYIIWQSWIRPLTWRLRVNMTLYGSTWTNMNQATLSDDPYMIKELLNDAGDVQSVLIKCSCWLHPYRYFPFLRVFLINVSTKRLYKFGNCKYRTAFRNMQSVFTCKKMENSAVAAALSIVQEQFTAYTTVLSFNSKHRDEHSTPVDASEPGIIRLHSDSPEGASFWGYEAPEFLSRHESAVTVETVRIPEDERCEDLDLSKYKRHSEYLPGSNTTVYNYLINSTNHITSLTVTHNATARLPAFDVTYIDTNGRTRSATHSTVNGKYRVSMSPSVKVDVLNITYRGRYELQPRDVILRHCVKAKDDKRNTYGDHMEWTLVPHSKSIEEDPVKEFIHKNPPRPVEDSTPPRKKGEVTVMFYSNNVICSNDDIEYREAFNTILGNPGALFENIKVSVRNSRDGTSEVTLSFDVILYNNDRIDKLIDQMKQELNRHRDNLPCTTPFLYKAPRVITNQQDHIFPDWAIGVASGASILLVILIFVAVAVYQYIAKNVCRERGTSEQLRKFINAHVALSLKRLSETRKRYENMYVAELCQGERATTGRDLTSLHKTGEQFSGVLSDDVTETGDEEYEMVIIRKNQRYDDRPDPADVSEKCCDRADTDRPGHADAIGKSGDPRGTDRPVHADVSESGDSKDTDRPGHTDVSEKSCDSKDTERPGHANAIEKSGDSRDTDRPDHDVVSKEQSLGALSDDVTETGDEEYEMVIMRNNQRYDDRPDYADVSEKCCDCADTDRPGHADAIEKSCDSRDTDRPGHANAIEKSGDSRDTDRPGHTDVSESGDSRDTDRPGHTDVSEKSCDSRDTDRPGHDDVSGEQSSGALSDDVKENGDEEYEMVFIRNNQRYNDRPDHADVSEKCCDCADTERPGHADAIEKSGDSRGTDRPDHADASESGDSKDTDRPGHTDVSESGDSRDTDRPGHTGVSESGDSRDTDRPGHTGVSEKSCDSKDTDRPGHTDVSESGDSRDTDRPGHIDVSEKSCDFRDTDRPGHIDVSEKSCDFRDTDRPGHDVVSGEQSSGVLSDDVTETGDDEYEMVIIRNNQRHDDRPDHADVSEKCCDCTDTDRPGHADAIEKNGDSRNTDRPGHADASE